MNRLLALIALGCALTFGGAALAQDKKPDTPPAAAGFSPA